MKTLVIASRNRKKVQELVGLLQVGDLNVLTLDDVPGAPEVVEDGATFAENAELKAITIARATGQWTIGDDSGLMVDALGGAPGVTSARYAGEFATDEENNDKLLEELRDVPLEKRGAQFVCHLALASPDVQVQARAEGHVRGLIVDKPYGSEGFGYDPLFLIPEYHQTFGQLSPLVKSVLSHRARAAAKMAGKLRQLLALSCVAMLWGVLLLCTGASVCAADNNIAAQGKYAAVAEKVSGLVRREMQDKSLPAVSIALVDDQQIVWAQGFGHEDAERMRPATAETVYRVGSISKLLTDLAIMQLVERGELNLDAPIQQYIPEFAPQNPFDRPITLRQLMSHRAGLVREPPVGNYFDPTQPTLEATVLSLNTTALVYPPESRTKYSNAGIGVAGLVLERTRKQPFPEYVQTALFEPLEMKRSSFQPDDQLRAQVAQGVMWTYDGREFPAPDFLLGTSAAGNLYASATDLARLQIALFQADESESPRLLKRSTLEQMWKPQFAPDDATSGFGLGFFVSPFAGHRRIGHGGAVYGHATRFAALPDEKLGVVVTISKDVANGVADAIGDYALRLALATREKKPLPDFETTQPIPQQRALQLVGTWRSGVDYAEINQLNDVVTVKYRDTQRVLRAEEDHFVGDDVQGRGPRIEWLGDNKLRIDGRDFLRMPDRRPPPAPERWRKLIGEYGWDHNTLYILEAHGQLYALIEWFFYYPLTHIDGDTYRFPDYGLYQDERLVFERDESGKVTKVIAAEVPFLRREQSEAGETFRIQPQQSIEQLRRAALAADPPSQSNDLLKPQLVQPTQLDGSIKLDVRYATANNFMGEVFYEQARAYLQKPAAEALVRVHRQLADHGYGLLIHDAYRPWYVTKMFFDAVPADMKIFVANPANGSRHNRGAAVDLTLYDLATQQPVEMVAGYDEFSTRSFPTYPGGTTLQRWQRDLLRRAMEKEEFRVYEFEWWHFDYGDWSKYPLLNVPFDQLPAAQ